MSDPTPPPVAAAHEPGLGTVEMLCERLGELGLPIGPDTAREILRAVLAMEAPRMDAHLRDALQTSIDTIRVAAQSANGVLASTTTVRSRAEPRTPPKPVLDPPAPRRATPPPAQRATPSRRPPPKRNPEDDDGASDADGETRPVFRRPRGR
jgi:hypothetical protein